MPTDTVGRGHVEQMLEPLASREYRLLTRRQWPRTRRAQVDVVVIGPSGVFVVGWLDGTDVLVGEDVMLRGSDDVTGEALALADLADRIEAEPGGDGSRAGGGPAGAGARRLAGRAAADRPGAGGQRAGACCGWSSGAGRG